MLRSATRQKILGVDFTHLALGDRGDLYLTDHGVPWVECLLPENFWTDKEWFKGHSERLSGTSSVYKVRTKSVAGKQKDIVLKWNRMGQEIPGDREDPQLAVAEFNSPFEEFSLAMELGEAIGASWTGIITHVPLGACRSTWSPVAGTPQIANRKPLAIRARHNSGYSDRLLAIYVRSDRTELWRMGRREYMMRAIIEKHVEIELDMFRSYAVIYEWMDGVDATQALRKGLLDATLMESLTTETYAKMKSQGFDVTDHKPHHIIVRPCGDGTLHRERGGSVTCGVVDYELLARTPEREQLVRRQRRTEYLRKQRDRFHCAATEKLPSHLRRVNIMGVDYTHGHCKSTDGMLWVVGKDPDLFEYFLPEKWERTEKNRLSAYSEVFHTVTKDDINLVWKVSKVGLQPDVDPFKKEERRILEFGYNSPFEEVSLAVALSRAGMPTVYPRAVYRTGVKTEMPDALADDSRYERHKGYVALDGSPILTSERDYILIWGFWNGPDEKLADEDGDYYRGVDALRAMREGLLSYDEYLSLLEGVRARLLAVGIEDLNLRGSHILLSTLASTGHLITDKSSVPEVRICSFELLKRC
jgi:hypothetical protein